MPTIGDVSEKLVRTYKERNPKILDKTLEHRRDHLRYLSKFFPQPLGEITQEQVETYVKSKGELVSRETLLIDLRALEDCFEVSGTDAAPVASVLDKLRKRGGGTRRQPRPEYARAKGYSTRKQGELRAPASQPRLVQATIINNSQERQVVEGDCLSSVLLEAVIEIDRQAKAGRGMFILLIGQ